MIIKYHLINKGTSRECCPAPELVFGSSPSNDAGPSDDLRAIEVTEVKLIKHGCLAGWQAKKIQRFGRHESKICYICCMDFILFLHRHCKGTLNYPKKIIQFFLVSSRAWKTLKHRRQDQGQQPRKIAHECPNHLPKLVMISAF